MPVVEDKGNWRSQLNSKLANIIANVLGQRVNYTIRYYRHRGHLPNFKHPKICRREFFHQCSRRIS